MGVDPIKLIAEQGYGEAVEEMSAYLPDLLHAIRTTAKKGSITLKLDFEPVKGSDGRQVAIRHRVTVQQPRKEGMASVMYVTDDGGLSRRDPRQPELPFREVARNEPEVSEQEEVSNG